MDNSKKYLTISEVALKLNVSAYTLRYLEKKNPQISVSKIRGRRYYQSKDVTMLIEAMQHTDLNNINESEEIEIKSTVKRKPKIKQLELNLKSVGSDEPYNAESELKVSSNDENDSNNSAHDESGILNRLIARENKLLIIKDKMNILLSYNN